MLSRPFDVHWTLLVGLDTLGEVGKRQGLLLRDARACGAVGVHRNESDAVRLSIELVRV